MPNFRATKPRLNCPSRRLRLEQLESRYLLAAFDLLVFSKTAGYRHNSIETGITAIEALGLANDFSVTATEDANQFTPANLSTYEAVVFLNTTGDVLNDSQQSAFEQYVRTGGGWVGVHAAADTEYAWSWYGDLVGAYFENHSTIQTASIVVADQVHPSTAHLPEVWQRTDEWYNYQINPRGDVHVLATLDESSYQGGVDGFDHPIAWHHDYDGGRAWYTGLGHTESSYSEEAFLDHLLGGILYAAGEAGSDGGATIESNFRKVELYGDSTNPMSLAIADDNRVFFVEKGGAVKLYDPVTENTTTIAQLDVYTGEEDGLLGIALDPQFAANRWIYLFYSPAGAVPKQHVSRFTLTNDQLDLNSEQILLEVPTQRDECCHSAGSLDFDAEGMLYISTGDNTNPFDTPYAPIDERAGRSPWDAQKSSSNANDLRGKILRIKPEINGTYSIPTGNLFPADGSAGRPEIYVMGSRNPFRFSIDEETGWLYWGDVGPDANNDNVTRGPRGYDEINQARAAGNFGWPYVIADNQAYYEYDFATGTTGDLFDPDAPLNNSPNNTGPQQLPPAKPALIWYPDPVSAEFPELGSGGRSAMAGPLYHFDANLASPHKLPAYFDDTLFISDWSRRSFHEVKLDAQGNVLKINPFLPETLQGVRPIDMEVGPDGALYVLEWTGGFSGASGANLLRVEFLGGHSTIAESEWDGDRMIGIVGDGTTWGDPSNWSTNQTPDVGPPTGPPGGDVTFSSGAVVGAIQLDVNRTVNSVTFTAGFELEGAALEISSGKITVTDGITATINSDVSSTSGVTQQGSGTLVLNGNVAQTVVEQGVLSGTGTLDSLVVGIDAAVNPAVGVGALTVNGESAILGTLIAEVATDTDLLNTSGIVRLQSGSSLQLTVLGELGATGNVSRTIVSSPDPVVGMFTDIPASVPAINGGGVGHLGFGGFFKGVRYNVLAGNVVVDLFQAAAGDADGDGLVLASRDGAVLVSSLNAGDGKNWTDGDFNHDGVVTASLDGAQLLAGLGSGIFDTANQQAADDLATTLLSDDWTPESSQSIDQRARRSRRALRQFGGAPPAYEEATAVELEWQSLTARPHSARHSSLEADDSETELQQATGLNTTLIDDLLTRLWRSGDTLSRGM